MVPPAAALAMPKLGPGTDMLERLSGDLFQTSDTTPGGLACAIEVAATMTHALDRARERGVSHKAVVEKMSFHLGEKLSEAMLYAYTSTSHEKHEVSLRRAMAFDAALGEDNLLNLFASKRGNRRVISADDAALLELGRIHQAERELAERKRLLQAVLKTKS